MRFISTLLKTFYRLRGKGNVFRVALFLNRFATFFGLRLFGYWEAGGEFYLGKRENSNSLHVLHCLSGKMFLHFH